MSQITITLDTSVVNRNQQGEIDIQEITDAAKGLNINIAKTSVANREQGVDPGDQEDVLETAVWNESVWGQARWGGPLPETFVLNESLLDQAVLADSGDMLEAILKVSTNGSFPASGKRNNLTETQKHQLRDAMTLEAHVREGRDIFVSDDTKAIGKPGSELRSKLQAMCQTKLMTKVEFIEYCKALRDSEHY